MRFAYCALRLNTAHAPPAVDKSSRGGTKITRRISQLSNPRQRAANAAGWQNEADKLILAIGASMLPVVFYRTGVGNEPIREWLRSLSDKDSKTIGVDLKTVQFGWPLGMPLCRPLGNGLWEVRSRLSGNRIARLMFFLKDGSICVVNGFIKKTQKTPPEELEQARKRMKEWCDD